MWRDVVSVELDEWLSEAEAAAAVKKSVRTLRDWRRKGMGPPFAYFGRTPRYRAATLIEHFRAAEIAPVRARKSRATPGSRGSQVMTGGE
jgi:hypothetical protein